MNLAIFGCNIENPKIKMSFLCIVVHMCVLHVMPSRADHGVPLAVFANHGDSYSPRSSLELMSSNLGLE